MSVSKPDVPQRVRREPPRSRRRVRRSGLVLLVMILVAVGCTQAAPQPNPQPIPQPTPQPAAAGEPQVEMMPAATSSPTPTAEAPAVLPTATLHAPTSTPVPSPSPTIAGAPESPLAGPVSVSQSSWQTATHSAPPLPSRIPLRFPTATPTETADGAAESDAPARTEYPSAATAEAQLAIASMLTATLPVSVPMSAAMVAALTAVAPEAGVSAESLLPTPTTRPEQAPLPEQTPVPAVAPVAESLPLAPEGETPAPAPLAQAALAPDGVERAVRLPILMYHYLSVPPADADVYRRDLSVSPDLFAAHLDRLRAEGYTTVSLYDLAAALGQGAPLPDKPVILTFDDGYRDNYENAFPLLRDRGMKATFFLVTDFIDEQRPEYMTWDMAREMFASGMSIESHGRNHVSLAGKDDDYLVWQTLGSLETIQHELGQRPRFLSYPAGEYDARTIAIVQSANYWAAVTTQQGAMHDSRAPFELTRVRVRGTTSPDDLANLLALDW